MIRNRGHGIPASGGLGRKGYQGAGRGRSPSAAQLLLQKANTQLRGERVPVKPKEEDELANYLNSLTQKTSLQAKSVNYEEYGDISISSGADAMTPTAHRTPSPAAGPGSKFLKKKAIPPVEDANPSKKSSDGKAYGVKPSESGRNRKADTVAGSGDVAMGKVSASGTMTATATVPKVGTAGSAPGLMKKGGFQMSSTLSKASALAERITKRSTAPEATHYKYRSPLDRETDESVSSGPGRSKDVKGKESGSRPGSAESSAGHDGRKFCKKVGLAQAASQAENGGKSPSRAHSRERSKSKSPAEPKVKKSSSKLHMPSNIYLTSEEESMAEFIAALTGSDESKSIKGKKRHAPGKAKPHVSHSPSPSPSPQRRSRRQTLSPGSSSISRGHSRLTSKTMHPAVHRMSSSDSMVSDVADSKHERIMIADSISLEEPFEIKLLDAGTLGPVMLMTPELAAQSEPVKKSKKAKVTPFKKSPSPSGKKKKKKSKESKPKKNKTTSGLFQSFGVQSVEDLLSDEENTESEIPTEPIAGRKRNQSTSQIVTEIGGSQATSLRQVSYSEDFENSISEKIADSREPERWGKKANKSTVRSENSEEETRVDYSEDFSSETLSVAKEDSDRSSHYRYSDGDQTETSETLSDASSKPHQPTEGRKLVVEQKSVEIQTALPSGLNYQWMSHTGVSVMGPSYGLAGVDPTPIASTVISADALETLTSYNPAALAIHDMLKQQIDLIKQFADAHQRLYHSLSNSNVPDYKYTTLEGTKSYIEKHSRPRLTMKQALRMVDEEMNRQ